MKRKRHLWLVVVCLVAALVLVGLVRLVVLGYNYQWTGFNKSVIERETRQSGDSETTEVAQDIQRSRTLWDWLNLLIVPVVLAGGGAIGGYLFNQAVQKREHDIAQRNAENEALETYLQQMTELALDKENDGLSKANIDNEVLMLLQARTQPLLHRLEDVHRRSSIVRFLAEAGLIHRDPDAPERSTINISGVSLAGSFLPNANFKTIRFLEANFKEANLQGANFRGAVLRGANFREADLRRADFRGAKLEEADFTSADLRGADLNEARLQDAVLRRAVLDNAHLQRARFHGADLARAQFIDAHLDGAVLTRTHSTKKANFRRADLNNADVRYSDFSKAKNLSQSQIDSTALGNEETRLPKGRTTPETWSTNAEGDKS